MDILTADLVDAHETEVMSCTVQFRSYGGRERFCGPVRTLKTMEDNLLIRQLLSQEGYGSILVVDGAGSLRSALVGDLIAQRAQDQGWAGLVIWGAVRDVVALSALSIGIKAVGSNPRKSTKSGSGEVDVPVYFGDVQFRPGQWLYSDEDGLIVANQKLA